MTGVNETRNLMTKTGPGMSMNKMMRPLLLPIIWRIHVEWWNWSNYVKQKKFDMRDSWNFGITSLVSLKNIWVWFMVLDLNSRRWTYFSWMLQLKTWWKMALSRKEVCYKSRKLWTTTYSVYWNNLWSSLWDIHGKVAGRTQSVEDNIPGSAIFQFHFSR